MLEQEIQGRFASLITGTEEISGGDANRILLYRDLVEYRFKEVIYNTYPILTKKAGKNRLRQVIQKFIQSKAATPFIWEMPNEFRCFVKTHHEFTELPYASDLLWYEWTEVELFMKNYESQPFSFSREKSWQWSDSAAVRELKYAVYKDDYENAGHYPLVLYYNFEKNEVHFRELTPFLVFLIEHSKTIPASEALAETCRFFELQTEEVEPLLLPALEEFASLRIISPVKID